MSKLSCESQNSIVASSFGGAILTNAVLSLSGVTHYPTVLVLSLIGMVAVGYWTYTVEKKRIMYDT